MVVDEVDPYDEEPLELARSPRSPHRGDGDELFAAVSGAQAEVVTPA